MSDSSEIARIRGKILRIEEELTVDNNTASFSGDVNVSGNLYVSNSVGVGTVNPIWKFTVENNNYSSGEQIFNGFRASDQSTGVFIGYRADGTTGTGGVVRSGGNTPLYLGTTGTPQAVTLLNDGKMGVGTTNPGYKLAVGGYSDLYPACFKIEESTHATSRRATISFGNNWEIGQDSSGNGIRNFYFYQAGVGIPLFIDTANNIGVGTTNPGAKLDVNGSIKIPLATNTDNSSPGIIYAASDDFLYDGLYLNHYGMGFHSPVNTAGAGAYISGYYGIDLFTAGINRLSIVNNGNVGIGTTTPNAKLDINGTTNISGNLSFDTTRTITKPSAQRIDFAAGSSFWSGIHFATQDAIVVGASTNYPRTSQFWSYDNGGTNPTYLSYYNIIGNLVNANPNYLIGLNEGTGSFSIITQGSERLRVDKTGSVGIGAFPPTAKIETYQYTNDGTATPMQKWSHDQNNWMLRLDQVWPAGLGRIDYAFRIRNGNTTDIETLYFRSNGSVGVGATDPSVKLDVDGVIRARRNNTSTEGGELQLSRAFDNATKWYIDAQGSGDLSNFRVFDNSSSVALQINSQTRNIGLGGNVNFTPTVAVHVKNANSSYTDPENNNLPTVFASNTSNASTTSHAILGTRVGGASGGDPFVSFDINGVTGWSIGVDNSDNDKFKIANSWNDVGSGTDLTIQTNGNVGIGTTSPNARLHVLNNGPAFSLEGTDHVYMQWYPDGTAAGRKAYTGFPDSTANYFIIANEIATNGDIILQPGTNADVGINTTTPVADLDINNGALGTTSGNTIEALRLTSTVSNASLLRFYHRRFANGSDWFTAATRIQQSIDGLNMGYIEFNGPTNGRGGIIIGTDYTGAGYPLYINDSYTITTAYGFLNSAGSVGLQPSTNTNISLRASSRIAATEFNAISDARNKEVFFDVEVDLKEKFRSINVTNFIHKNELGSTKSKGVIAQEIEQLFPDAVSKTTDYVYDIFCLCKNIIKVDDEKYKIIINKLSDLKKNDEIKIFYKDLSDNKSKEKFLTIEEIVDEKTFIVNSGDDISNECVVVGRKVDDFRVVNYQYLNSITTKMVQELMVENDYLKNKLEEKDKQIQDILLRLATLENK